MIYTSSNYGVTWVEQSVGGRQGWSSVGISSSGQILVVAQFNFVFTSQNYGATWIRQFTNQILICTSIAVTSSGRQIFANSTTGYIDRGTLP
jgi:hypothetical protein